MTSLSSLVPLGVLKNGSCHMILQMSVKVVLILSGMMHLALGGKNSIHCDSKLCYP